MLIEICAGVSVVAFAASVCYVFYMLAEEGKDNETDD